MEKNCLGTVDRERKKKRKKEKKNEGRRWSTRTQVLDTRFLGGRHVEKVSTQTRFIAQNRAF